MPVQSDAEVFALPVQPASRPANLTLRRMVRFYSFSNLSSVMAFPLCLFFFENWVLPEAICSVINVKRFMDTAHTLFFSFLFSFFGTEIV